MRLGAALSGFNQKAFCYMTYMLYPTLHPRSTPLLRSFVFLSLALALGPFLRPSGQAQEHGASVQKVVHGPDQTERAHVGDTVTNFFRVRNFDGFMDTLTITSIVDVIQSGSGPVFSPNLMAGPTNLLFFQFVDRSFTASAKE